MLTDHILITCPECGRTQTCPCTPAFPGEIKRFYAYCTNEEEGCKAVLAGMSRADREFYGRGIDRLALAMRLHLADALAEKAGVDLFADMVRASGASVCETCGLPYGQHPEIRSTFALLCDGSLVKL